jgi:carbamoyl-phosphate synthase large subunit
MMIRTNVLFTAAGRRVSLVRQFQRALRTLGDSGLTISADASATAPAHQVADHAVALPRVDAAAYVPALLEMCRGHDVRLLVPLIDPELPVLAAHRAAFAAIGTTVLVSDPATVAIASDKRRTAEHAAGHGFRVPRTLDPDAMTTADLPVFAKPAGGSASEGAAVVRTLPELAWRRSVYPDLLVQELLTGAEYTVDVWCDISGQVRCAVPRRRLAVRAGEVSKGVTGCLTLQVFKAPNGTLTLVEINARFGGGFPLSAHAGADYPLWALQESRGDTPDYARGEAFRDGLMMLRYDDELIVSADALPFSLPTRTS